MSFSSRLRLLVVGVLLLFVVSVSLAFANPIIISRNLTDVVSVRASDDGHTVYYSGYWARTVPVIERYDSATGERIILADGGDVSPFFDLSPNEELLAYTEEDDNDGSIYVVPTTGGTPTVVASEAQIQGNPGVWGFTPDNQTLIILDETDFATIEKAYAVSVNGGPLTDLTVGLPVGDVDDIHLNSTGTHVGFTYTTTAGRRLMVLTPIGGGPAVILNPTDASVLSNPFIFSPDGSTLYFANGTHIYRADVATGAVTAVTPEGYSVENFYVSEDEQYLLFEWRATGEMEQLYRLTFSDNEIVPLTQQTTGEHLSIRTAPRNGRVVYGIRQGGGNHPSTLYSIDIAGGTPAELGVSGTYPTVSISQDGAWVVYDEQVPGVNVGPFYSVPIDGSQPRTTLYSGSDGYRARIAPSGEWVFFSTYSANAYGLYTVPLTGGTPNLYFERAEPGVMGMYGFLSDDRLLMVDNSSGIAINGLYLVDPAQPMLTPTPTITRTPTLTRTPTGTPTITRTPTVTRTPSATLTPSMTATVTPTPSVTATPSVTPSATHTPTPTPVPSEVRDGSFEAGRDNPYWDEYSETFGTPICDLSCGPSEAHTGTGWVRFGAVPNVTESALVSQLITLPPGATELSFWLRITDRAARGYVSAQIDSNEVFRAEHSTSGFENYALVRVDISSWTDGGIHELRFVSQTIGEIPDAVTTFLIDDVAIAPLTKPTTTPPPTITATATHTPLATATVTPTIKASTTAMPTNVPTSTTTPVPTATPLPTHTATVTPGVTPTLTSTTLPTTTTTPVATRTATATATHTVLPTIASTATVTPIPPTGLYLPLILFGR